MYDFLIIGHGLAGAILSHRLIDRGYRVLVIDQPNENKSSSVAAGLYNPITGRKMVKTWMADDLFPEIEPTYQGLESKLGSKFLYPTGIYRPFFSIEEKNDWEGRSSDEKFKPYIAEVSGKPVQEMDLNDQYGGLHLKQAGYLDIPVFLESSMSFLQKRQSYVEERFDEEVLDIRDNLITWNNISFDKVVFCNGIAAQESNFFNWLPFSPVKGELMDGSIEKEITTIYNRGVFLVPIGSKSVRVGATYKNTFEDDEPSKAGRDELMEKMKSLTSEKFIPTKQKAGIRPATKDRRPFIGKHPEYEHIYVFNGFGSKGVSMIPYFSNHFIEYLEEKIALNEHVNLNRFLSHYREMVDQREE